MNETNEKEYGNKSDTWNFSIGSKIIVRRGNDKKGQIGKVVGFSKETKDERGRSEVLGRYMYVEVSPNKVLRVDAFDDSVEIGQR